ncbi:hypothetical protein SeLEV6574_g05388, partial [Synchytrium endobioticum]
MASTFSDAAERVAAEFLKHPTEKTLLNFLLLPKAGLGLGLMEADKPTNDILKEFQMSILTPPDREKKISKRTTDNRPTTSRAQKLVEQGSLGRAARALTNPASLAALTQELKQKLEGKHPRGQARAFSTTSNPRAGPSPSNEDLMEALGTFPTDTAPGLSGWTVTLLKEVVKRKPVLEFLVLLCKMLQLGTAPGKALLTASRLIALNKEDGGVRPIAVGEIIYRLMAKVVLKKSLRPNMLAEFQLGVKSKGGVEPIIHLINDVMEGKAKGYNY